MNIKLSLYTGTLVLSSLLLTAVSAQAAVLNPADLPGTIQSCEAGASCSADTANHLDLPGMTAVEFTRFGAGAVTQSWLLRYDLYAPSANTHWEDFNGTGGTTTVTPYTGNIWVEAPQLLNISGQNLFSIYTDQINPDPDNANPVQDSTFVFSMSALDAINGGAYYFNSGDDGSGTPITVGGSLVVIDGIFTCVECGVDVSLNLVGLDYSTGGASLIPGDTRTRLLQYADFFDTFSNDRSFNVSPVPLPTSGWLFASGVLGLLKLVRKKRVS